MSCRVRVINLTSKRVLWKNPPNVYMGAWVVEHPQRALLYAESIIAAWGDEVVRVCAVDLLHDPEEDLGGILVRGEKVGVLIEGADM